MIGLIDYGLGNIQAFANIYRRLGIEAVAVSSPSEIAGASKLILPGVGAFDWAMERLAQSGLRDALDKAVLQRKVPVLGVCVGMQIMAEKSEEGILPGLGWVDGEVRRFVSDKNDLPLPHMGWNDIKPERHDSLFKGIEAPRYYFLHSYHVLPTVPEEVLSRTAYGGSFISAVQKDNVFGTQFHPEKSHHWGIALLKNFAELALT